MSAEQPFKNPDQGSEVSGTPALPADENRAAGADSRDTAIGVVIAGKYQIVQALGTGGWGNVYRARHLQHDIDVAVKFPDRRLLANPDQLKRFHQEAKACQTLVHPNFVNVSDHGVTNDGVPYIVMEYVEGWTLHALLAAGHPFAVDEVLQFSMCLADGLSIAHAAGFVHRDIKPGNIILAKNSGTPKLLDFGLVKSADSNLTRTGYTLGTPAYMSPEQFTGTDEPDGRSDIYSLGCVLYESLTGANPFLGESDMECLYKHLHFNPPPVSKAREPKPTPAGLDFVVAKAIAADRNDRYPDMQAFKADLEKVLKGAQGKKFHAMRMVENLTVKHIAVAAAVLCIVIVVCELVAAGPTAFQSFAPK